MVDPADTLSRAPEMRPVRGAGLGIRDARELRIRVDDGVLTVTTPDAAARIVTSVSEVTRAVWLSPQESRDLIGSWWDRGPAVWTARLTRPLMRRKLGGEPADPTAPDYLDLDPAFYDGNVVILDSNGPVFACPVAPFTPWAGDPSLRRELSGAVAVVRALGLVLEARTDADVIDRRAVREVMVAPDRGSRRRRALELLLVVLGGVLAFLTWPFGGTGAGVAAGAGCLVVTAPVLADYVRSWRLFRSLATNPPPSGDRVVYRPVEHEGAGAQLQFGRHDVVVIDGGGKEYWLPGPTLGGVARLEVADDDVHLTDARGRLLLALVAAEAAPSAAQARLSTACASAGVTVVDSGLWIAGPNLPVRLCFDDTWPPVMGIFDVEQGRLDLPTRVLLQFVSLMLLPGAIAAAVSVPPWGVLVLIGSLVWLGTLLWAALSFRHWRRGVMHR